MAKVQEQPEVIIRLVSEQDIPGLIQMRWDFTFEDSEAQAGRDEEHYRAFSDECTVFLQRALLRDKWYIWLAEVDGRIVSHVYLELIEKVPRPGRLARPFVYMTNVYTAPSFRGLGIGSRLLSAAKLRAAERQYEFIIVWPSERSTGFYRRNGYSLCDDPMELRL